MTTERVNALIDRVMAKHPGESDAAQLRYYEEVHQELAPLARELERRLDELQNEFAAYKTGSEEAFGTVVDDKKALEARKAEMQRTIDAQQSVICNFRGQRDELLAALKDCVLVMERELSGLKVIQPELNNARAAIASVKGGV